MGDFYVHETAPVGKIVAGNGKYTCYTPDGERAFSNADVNVPLRPDGAGLPIGDAIKRIEPVVKIGDLAINFEPIATKLLELQDGAFLRFESFKAGGGSEWHIVPGPELIQYFGDS
jgi:hypothetical protein